MAEVEVRLPKMGESVAEATIISWLKNEGDTVEAEDSLVEIATDKVDSEVPSPSDGVLVKILFNKDDVVKVGDVIAIIATDGADAPKETAPASVETKVESQPAENDSEVFAEKAMATVTSAMSPVSIDKTGDSGRFYSPLVRSIAKTEGVTMNELEQIQGTGQSGRVTKSDILSYLQDKGTNGHSVQAKPQVVQTQATQSASAEPAKATSIQITTNPGDEIVEMDRMRKLIAKHMVESKHTSPHVTSYVEADVTNLVNWRNKVKKNFEARENEKITFTPLFIQAIVKAIKDFPNINISVSGDNIIMKKNINIGMAAALPSGNLIVPVIKNADQLNLLGLTKVVNDLANRARNNQLKPEEIQGGTYTITNVGSFGNVMGTPIINQPQVAIMAVGSIRKIPAVIETPEGDFIGIRHKMFLSHSYDHRVVDGALGGMFVRRVADYLEQFDVNTQI